MIPETVRMVLESSAAGAPRHIGRQWWSPCVDCLGSAMRRGSTANGPYLSPPAVGPHGRGRVDSLACDSRSGLTTEPVVRAPGPDKTRRAALLMSVLSHPNLTIFSRPRSPLTEAVFKRPRA
jgi:hypothetical protein